MSVNTEIQIAPIGETKTPSAPLVLPGRTKNDTGGADDFSLPSPKAQVVELTGMSSQSVQLPGDDLANGKEDESDPYPLYHLKGRNLIEPVQVACERGSLNSGDVFVIDMRAHPLYCVIQWTGYDANRREKSAGRGFCDKLVNEVHVCVFFSFLFSLFSFLFLFPHLVCCVQCVPRLLVWLEPVDWNVQHRLLAPPPISPIIILFYFFPLSIP